MHPALVVGAVALVMLAAPAAAIVTLHAEVEGGPLLAVFTAWLEDLRRTGRALVRVRDLAETARLAAVPECNVTRGHVPGRSGWVAVAGGV